MSASAPLDSLGLRRSPAAVPGYLAGRRPRSKGRRYPPDPPRTEEIIAVMRCCGDGLHGDRARGLIAVLWRAGLRIQEALDLGELDLDARRGSVLVRSGKGGPAPRARMDNWGFEQLEPWLRARETMPVGPLFCVINGPSCGHAWHASAARMFAAFEAILTVGIAVGALLTPLVIDILGIRLALVAVGLVTPLAVARLLC